MAGDGSMSVSAEDITGVYLAFYVRETVVKAVGNDGLALLLEGVEVVDDFAAEDKGVLAGKINEHRVFTDRCRGSLLVL